MTDDRARTGARDGGVAMGPDRAIEAADLARAGLDVEGLHMITGLSREVCRGLVRVYGAAHAHRMECELHLALEPQIVSAFGRSPHA